jgi:hypothetical protein
VVARKVADQRGIDLGIAPQDLVDDDHERAAALLLPPDLDAVEALDNRHRRRFSQSA